MVEPMQARCACRSVASYVGPAATSYAGRYLRELSASDAGGRLLRCRVCGAYWEMDEDDPDQEGSRRVRLQRVKVSTAVDDWSLYESEDRD